MLVHGTSADHTRWQTVLPELTARFTIYAVDRRGRGASGDAEPYAIEREFEDVAAVVDAIGGEVDVIGHSYGAICSLEAALLTTGVRRLVLYEPPLEAGLQGDPPAVVERMEALLAAGDREGVILTFFREFVRVPAGEVEVLLRDPSWQGRLAAAHTIPRELRSAELHQPGYERFAALRVPTLLLAGADSPPSLVEPSRRLSESIPDSRLALMPGQGHNAMTTAPELFLGEVFAFLG